MLVLSVIFSLSGTEAVLSKSTSKMRIFAFHMGTVQARRQYRARVGGAPPRKMSAPVTSSNNLVYYIINFLFAAPPPLPPPHQRKNPGSGPDGDMNHKDAGLANKEGGKRRRRRRRGR